MSQNGIVLFNSNSHAMRAEAVLKKARLDVKLVPTPRELSSDCGVSLRFAWADHEQVKTLLEQAHVEVAGVHQL